MARLRRAHDSHLFTEDPKDSTEEVDVIDLISGMWHIGFGHSALPVQADLAIPTIKYTHEVRERLATTLCELFGYSGVILGLNGSDVTDAAIRIALSLTKRTKVLALEEGYHGCTGYASLVGRDLNRRGQPQALQDMFDGGTVGRWAFAETIDERIMQEELGKIPWPELAAFIFEPVQGSAGGWTLHLDAYEAIAKRCKEHGVIIIADEVMTGLGRCGYLALTETYVTQPDMLALGKMLGNGTPISALLVNESIANKQDWLHRRGYYTMTNAGNLQGCHAALQVLEEVTTPGFLEGIRAKSLVLGHDFRGKFLDCPGIKAVRSNGLFFALAITSGELAERVHLALLWQDKLSVDLSGQKIRFCPPLVMEISIVEGAFTATQRRLYELAGGAS